MELKENGKDKIDDLMLEAFITGVYYDGGKRLSLNETKNQFKRMIELEKTKAIQKAVAVLEEAGFRKDGFHTLVEKALQNGKTFNSVFWFLLTEKGNKECIQIKIVKEVNNTHFEKEVKYQYAVRFSRQIERIGEGESSVIKHNLKEVMDYLYENLDV